MGKKDTVTKEYMSVPEYFADAYNFYLFDGEQIIRAKDLKIMDSTELGVIFSEENVEMTQKFRDVLKQCIVMEDEKCSYIILGIENQSYVHYAMPVKNLLYDALNYEKQVTELSREHQKRRDLRGDEFLSGFAKKDKLKPVITLVIYFGTEKWDAPRNLKEMFEEVDGDILKYVTDYKLNLLIPKEIQNFEKFQTDFGKVMKYISVSDEKEKYQEVVNEEPYKVIRTETARLLNECVGLNLQIEEEEENVKVCKAVQDIKEEEREIGRLEGESSFARLVLWLKENHREEEIVKAARDEEYREQLYREYQIE